MQLLNLFAYGTYPDYIGELVKILQGLFLIMSLCVDVLPPQGSLGLGGKAWGGTFSVWLCPVLLCSVGASHEDLPFPPFMSQWVKRGFVYAHP